MDIKITNNDLDITNNELTLITGIDETSQNITVNLKTILGEWFLDEAIGVPWLNEIFVKRNSLSQAQAILIDNIRKKFAGLDQAVRNVITLSLIADE